MSITKIQAQLESISHLVDPADYSTEPCVCCNGTEIYTITSKEGYICEGCEDEMRDIEDSHNQLLDGLPSW